MSEWLDQTGGVLLCVEIFFMSVLLFFTGRRWKTDFVEQNWRVNFDDTTTKPSQTHERVESEVSIIQKERDDLITHGKDFYLS